jgi:hypothetical protein
VIDPAAPLASAIHSATGSDFLGCYGYTATIQHLNGKAWTASEMTVERCATHCSEYDYFGVQSVTQ